MALASASGRTPEIDVFQCDITARPRRLGLVESIRDRYGKVDVPVNSAGIMEWVNFLEESVSQRTYRLWQKIGVNLTGPILLTRRLLPLLRSG